MVAEIVLNQQQAIVAEEKAGEVTGDGVPTEKIQKTPNCDPIPNDVSGEKDDPIEALSENDDDRGSGSAATPAGGGDGNNIAAEAEENSTIPSPILKTKLPKISVHKADFEKDVIYLYQFLRAPQLPSLSPYCLKLETWLRLAGLKYENVDHKMRFSSKKGQLPFIELNGEEIADTSVIIKKLSAKYDKDPDASLTSTQRNISYAMITMLENHLLWSILHWRAKFPGNVLKGYQINLRHSLGLGYTILNFLFRSTFSYKWFQGIKALGTHNLGVYKSDEVEEFEMNDLKVLSDMLGSKPFFFGNEPTNLDVVAFAVLSQVQYLSQDIKYPLRDFMTEKCRNLIDHVTRIKEMLYPDWDEICIKLNLNARLPQSEPEAEEHSGGDQAIPWWINLVS